MRIGTRSVLFGVHAFWLHPWFVAYGWYKLYGFPWDPRLWVAFFVHDLGYWGKPNMDGEEGEKHVLWGAEVMAMWFDRWWEAGTPMKWHDLCFLHSRYWAAKMKMPPSRLCYADKMAFVYTPWWLYRIVANASGEIKEYMAKTGDGKYKDVHPEKMTDQKIWFINGRAWVAKWVSEQTGAE